MSTEQFTSDKSLLVQDPAVADAISREQGRQLRGIELIASENFVSGAVLEAMGSVLTNKYAEGQSGKRYYGGCQFVDIVEDLAIERAKELFGAEHVNVQPHSGANANLAAYFALMDPGDTILGLSLEQGGHLTHGLGVNFSGRFYRGTGFLVGPRAVVTAGHCVYMHGLGWARSIEVHPGANGTNYPYGKVTSTSFRSVSGWVTSKRPESDYGCVVLPPGAFGGRNLGSFGFASLSAQDLVAAPAVLAGYPGDKPFAELWGMARRIKTVNATTLAYDIDTVGGESGAPVYIKRNGQRTVVGIHNYGASTGNSATRITPAVYNRLLAWRQL